MSSSGGRVLLGGRAQSFEQTRPPGCGPKRVDQTSSGRRSFGPLGGSAAQTRGTCRRRPSDARGGEQAEVRRGAVLQNQRRTTGDGVQAPASTDALVRPRAASQPSNFDFGAPTTTTEARTRICPPLVPQHTRRPAAPHGRTIRQWRPGARRRRRRSRLNSPLSCPRRSCHRKTPRHDSVHLGRTEAGGCTERRQISTPQAPEARNPRRCPLALDCTLRSAGGIRATKFNSVSKERDAPRWGMVLRDAARAARRSRKRDRHGRSGLLLATSSASGHDAGLAVLVAGQLSQLLGFVLVPGRHLDIGDGSRDAGAFVSPLEIPSAHVDLSFVGDSSHDSSR